MLAGGIIIAIMILPIITSVAREILSSVPDLQREAAYGLGATRWEVTRIAVLSYARRGLFGAVILGLGRALGETMAVTMVIGNRPQISASLFAPGYTLASVIANEFTEATSDMYLQALYEIGLVLFLVTIAANLLAQLILMRFSGENLRRGAKTPMKPWPSCPPTYITALAERRSASSCVSVVSFICAMLVIMPLGLVFFHLVKTGASSVNWAFFTQLPKPPLGRNAAAAWRSGNDGIADAARHCRSLRSACRWGCWGAFIFPNTAPSESTGGSAFQTTSSTACRRSPGAS